MTPPLEFLEVGVRWKKLWLTTDGMVKSHLLDIDESYGIYFRTRHAVDYQAKTLCGVHYRSMALPRRALSKSVTRRGILTESPTKQACEDCMKQMEEDSK